MWLIKHFQKLMALQLMALAAVTVFIALNGGSAEPYIFELFGVLTGSVMTVYGIKKMDDLT